MGNSIVLSLINVFDRRHLEIESISAKIDRAQSSGCYKKHEGCVENIGKYKTNSVGLEEISYKNDRIQVRVSDAKESLY